MFIGEIDDRCLAATSSVWKLCVCVCVCVCVCLAICLSVFMHVCGDNGNADCPNPHFLHLTFYF